MQRFPPICKKRQLVVFICIFIFYFYDFFALRARRLVTAERVSMPLNAVVALT
jgi:hypothetical protein